MQNEAGIIRTKMSSAFIKALDECVIEGRNPRRVGKRILTNVAKGVGIMYIPRKEKKNGPL